MAKFVPGRPQTTRESTIAVDAGLPAGVHRFQLVVVNAAGLKSAPDEVLVQIQATRGIPEYPSRTTVSPDAGAAGDARQTPYTPQERNPNMSTVARMPEADPLYAQPLSERPLYATGMLLDAQDFSDEQTYHRVQLARAMAFLAGGGTLAGLRVTHQAATPGPNGQPEEIRIEPGLAVDRLGRLIELPRPACLRLVRWYEAQNAIDAGDTLRRAAYANLTRFLSPRAVADAALPAAVLIPDRAVVADVFVRFVACPRGLTPSFAAGPF